MRRNQHWGAWIVATALALGGRNLAQPQTQTPPPTTPPAQAPAKSEPPKPQGPPPAAASPTTGWTESVITAPVVGQAWAYVPRHPVTPQVVLFISGDGNWTLGVIDMARRIMPKAVVVGISYNALRKAPGLGAQCWAPEKDLETVTQAVEKSLALPEYRPPILVGYSSGATLVYHALAAAPQAFAGGLSLGFCPELPSNHAVCAREGYTPGPHDAKKNEVILPKIARLDREWFVINGIQDQVCLPAPMHAFLDDMVNVHATLDIEGTGHGFAKPGYWGRTFDADIAQLLTIAAAIAK